MDKKPHRSLREILEMETATLNQRINLIDPLESLLFEPREKVELKPRTELKQLNLSSLEAFRGE